MEKTSRGFSKKEILYFTIRICLGLVLGILMVKVPGEYLEYLSYDLRVRSKVSSPVSGEVATIGVTESTIQALKHEPTLRDHRIFLQKLLQLEPKVILYLFDPSELRGSEIDKFQMVELAENSPSLYFVSSQLAMKGEEGKLTLAPPFQSLQMVSGPTTADVKVFGKDGVTRRLITSYKGYPTVPSVIAKAMRPEWDESRLNGMFELYGSNQIFIDFHPKGFFKPLEFHKILAGSVDKESVKGKIIFVGSDTGLNSKDYVRTPFSRDLTAMSNLEL